MWRAQTRNWAEMMVPNRCRNLGPWWVGIPWEAIHNCGVWVSGGKQKKKRNRCASDSEIAVNMVKMEEDPTLTKLHETSGLGLCPESQKERGDQSARTHNHFRSANHSIYHAVEKDSMHIGRVFLIRLSHCRQERMGKRPSTSIIWEVWKRFRLTGFRQKWKTYTSGRHQSSWSTATGLIKCWKSKASIPNRYGTSSFLILYSVGVSANRVQGWLYSHQDRRSGIQGTWW